MVPNSLNRSGSRELQIVNSPPSGLPVGWIVEERPRVSKPTHIDRYYYEPYTGRQFRSLLSVQRHLAEKGVNVVTKRMPSENKNTKYIDSGAGQCSSLRAVEKFLSEGNPCTITPKSVRKSDPGTGEQRARGGRSGQKTVHKRPSVVEENKNTLKSLKLTVQSPKLDSVKKTKLEENNRVSMHNLTEPPPAKVSWVLSCPGGFWCPFLDDSIVSESEKLKWSEAFVLSIYGDGVLNGFNS